MENREPGKAEHGRFETVEFGGGRLLAVLGLCSGLAIALVLPWMTLRFGDRLSSTQQVVIIIVAATIGGAVAFTAAFFGTVIPSSVSSPAQPENRRTGAAPATGLDEPAVKGRGAQS